ncbi:DUF5941 domain-containing protein [Spirillospora sp. NPDC029432]|uniref:DUF5941 domain-containing protein n=1 Tax=Spirillospora sp. NPDC029432 TaxID=3154599 RepID=UPI0034553528
MTGPGSGLLRDAVPHARGGPGAGGAAVPDRLRAYRDDGPVVLLIGRLGWERPSPPVAVGLSLLLTAVLLAAGAGGWYAAAALAPPLAAGLTGPSARRPLEGRIDWLVPPGLRTIEYGYLAALGFAQGVAAPLVYVLLAVLAYHHYDIVYRTHQGFGAAGPLRRAGLGWDGRMLVAGLAGLAGWAGLSGALPFAYAALAVYLGVLFVGDSVAAWARTVPMSGRGAGRDAVRGGVTGHLEEEEA